MCIATGKITTWEWPVWVRLYTKLNLIYGISFFSYIHWIGETLEQERQELEKGQELEIASFKKKIADQDLRTEAMMEHFTDHFKAEMMEKFAKLGERIAYQEEKIAQQEDKISEQEKTILKQDQKILEQDEKIAKMKPKFWPEEI